jgi:hypothetical protein
VVCIIMSAFHPHIISAFFECADKVLLRNGDGDDDADVDVDDDDVGNPLADGGKRLVRIRA